MRAEAGGLERHWRTARPWAMLTYGNVAYGRGQEANGVVGASFYVQLYIA